MIPRRRRWRRIAREENALSPRTRSGRVRGRPRSRRGTRRWRISGKNMGASLAWPGLSSTTIGRPWPSTTWWIFVVSPPRDRPTAWSGGSASRFVSFDPAPRGPGDVGGVLMGSGDGGVHRHRPVNHPDRIRRGEQPLQHGVPDAICGHPAMPRPDRLPRPEHRRHIPPRGPTPVCSLLACGGSGSGSTRRRRKSYTATRKTDPNPRKGPRSSSPSSDTIFGHAPPGSVTVAGNSGFYPR